jgi:multiple sugar transport system substrate-binding protein
VTDIKDAIGRNVSRRKFLTGIAAGAGLAASGGLLAACGGGSTGGPGGGAGGGGGGGAGSGSLTWANWANPGEAERFKKFSTDYASKNNVKVTYQTVTGTYATKMVTQLAGGSAPDAFYVGDDLMAKAIQSGSVLALDDYLASSDAAVKVADIYPGLLPWCKKDGKIYGLPVDCNPKVFWFNKKMLATAGVTSDPAAMQEAGTWNQAALDDLLTKVKATGKRGLVFEANWFELCGWITALGGKAVDDKGNAIFDTDPKAVEIIGWILDHINAGTITYGGSLPKGQGVDALFYGSQLATITYGRWILPNVKKLKNFEYDIAPLPSASGKDIAETAVYCAAMSVNAKAKDQAAALKFTGNFVNADGQKFRLSGGGNAVPCINGLDDVVTEGNLPAHGAWFSEVAKKGYTTPQVLVENPTASTNFSANLNTLILSKPDAKTLATKAAAMMNGKA